MLKPIQLIRFDSKKNVQLTQQAIDLFTTLQSKQLCIVCVAGKYRTGKSYILNRVILQQNNGFEVGPTINACTKGLWMWPQIVKINCHGHVKQCLIIDTEGLGSLEQGENTDLKIFLLAMLLSSYLIYNSVGSIDQKALQSLNLVINMAQLLQKSTNSYDSQQLINTFPQFLWLVRDFSLRLENQHGQVITSQQYLQTALSQKKGKTPVCKFAHLLQAAERKNAIRRQLKTFFKERDCFTLIRPTMNEKDLQNLSTLPQKKLRPQFLTLIHELKQRIHQSIQPKKLRGKPLTPQGFIQLCQSYILSINSGKLPTISSSWDNLCMSESSRVIKKYEMKLREYVRERQMMGGEQQVQVGQLTEISEKLLVQATEMIDRSFLGKLQKKLLKQKLQKTMKQTMGEIFSNKFNSIQQKVQKQLRQLFNGQQIVLGQDENTDRQQDGQISVDNNNTNKRHFNIYHHVDSLKSIIDKVQHIINTTITMDRQQSNNSNSKQLQLIKRVYKQFMQHIEQKMLTVIQEQMCNLHEENKQLKEKLLRMQHRNQVDIKQQKSVVVKLNKQLEQRERLLKKEQMVCLKLKDDLQKLKEYNQTYAKEVQLLKQSLQQQLIQFNQKLSLQQQSYSNKLRQQQINYQKQQQQLQLINSNIKHELHEIQIKQRKINRQCEIYKQKFIEKQKQVQCLNKEVEILKEQVMKLQREKRVIMVRRSMECGKVVEVRGRQMNSCVNKQQQQRELQQQKQQKRQKQNKQPQYSQPHHPQLSQLLTKLNLLQLTNSNLQQQNKQTLLLYQQQQSINNLLMNTPKTINYQSLKKNYDEEKKLSYKLNKKIKGFENVMTFVNRVECGVCGELVRKGNMFMGNNNNSNSSSNINSTNSHFIKCMASKIHDIEFDVSYVYDQQGELKFLFQIKMESLLSNNIKDSDNNDLRLRESRTRRGVQQYEQKENKEISWQVTKSLKLIRLLLKVLDKDNNEILLFNDLNDGDNINDNMNNNNADILKPQQFQHINTQQRTINLNQQRRLYLDEQCHKLKQQIRRNTLLIQFFSIDLHLLRQSRLIQTKRNTILATTKPLSQSQSQSGMNNSITTLANNNNNVKRRNKIGMLNLDLGEIIQQRNQNDSYNSINSSKKVLSQSLNFMKTTKFSMKKVFKFNNNV